MRKFDFLIGYDISSTKRLSQIAKYMESKAMRIQKSIFFYPSITKIDLNILVEKLISLMDEEEDDIRIYQIDTKNSISINSAIDLSNPMIII